MKESSTTSYWNSSSKLVATILIVLCITFIAGCPVPLDSQGQSMLARAHRSFESALYDDVIEVASQFLIAYPNAAERAEVFYLRGLSHRRQEPADNVAALMDLRHAINISARDSAIRSLAELAVGHILFEKNSMVDQLEAINHYQAALTHLPQTAPKDALLYRLACALQNVGQWTQADGYLSQCMNDFPDSAFADAARLRFGARQFRVQLAAYSNLTRATNHINQLAQDNITADWTSLQRGNDILYVVRYGRYDNYEHALEGLNGIRYVQPDATIVAAEPNTFTQPQ